jgi:hypothetical protein
MPPPAKLPSFEALMTSKPGYLESASCKNDDGDSPRRAGITGIGRTDRVECLDDREATLGLEGGAAESGMNFWCGLLLP